MNKHDPQRRIILRGALTAGCVLAVPALLSGCNRDAPPVESAADSVESAADSAESAADTESRGNQNGKMSQEQAEYQNQPKDDQQCSNCRFFVAENNTCEVVAGQISPQGWCKLWVQDA
jgi:hypothetical protein